MSMSGDDAYILAMDYADETIIGGGALKGKNCVVSNIEEVADGVNVTFQSILDDGTVKTDTAFIPRGTQGEAGVAGKSAYEIWLEAGNTGTEEDFLISLVGEKGADGTMTFEDLTEEQKASLKGEDGEDGEDGKDGTTVTIEENANNTNTNYKLNITTTDSEGNTKSITTPNLKGSDAVPASLELESVFCRLASYTPVLNAYIPFEKISGNMEVKKNGTVKVKAGQRVSISTSVAFKDTDNDRANIVFSIHDATNDKQIHYFNPYRDTNGLYEYYDTVVVQYTNDTSKDCYIGVKITQISTSDTLVLPILTVHEIGRVMVVPNKEILDDTVTSTDSTWSSSKIVDYIQSVLNS